MSFLAIDVGNTRLKWTLYEQPALVGWAIFYNLFFLDSRT
jgi:pantothenate kinase type III